jgi:hypothetical protein
MAGKVNVAVSSPMPWVRDTTDGYVELAVTPDIASVFAALPV